VLKLAGRGCFSQIVMDAHQEGETRKENRRMKERRRKEAEEKCFLVMMMKLLFFSLYSLFSLSYLFS